MNFPYGPVAVITGASSGIGRACAEIFARRGYRVWALSRRADGPTAPMGEGSVTPLACDVRAEASVAGAVAHIMEKEREIGTVVHCAGYGIAGACEDTPVEAAQAQMETNYFGVLRVNSHILPHMRARGGGMVIVVGSMMGIMSLPFQGHYASSKYALEAYVEALRMEGRPHGIRACILEPGDTNTGFATARESFCPADSPYGATCERAVARMVQDEQNGHPPLQTARVALRVAAQKSPPVRRAIGWSYKWFTFLRRTLPARLGEWILGNMYAK